MSTNGLILYSIGNPSDDEQSALELINRARANPVAEAALLVASLDPDVIGACLFFHVNFILLVSQFALIAPAPPLSLNSQLIEAARAHSRDMLTNAFQSHTGSDGRGPGARISAQGYTWSAYGENVYAAAKSVFHGHAGFEIDWGYGAGGMQTPPGHRQNIHSAMFREVGIGVVRGVNGSVGPQLVTHEFATASPSRPFITGVAYYDFNGNSTYDSGEGLGGVTVHVTPAAHYAITTASGGYSVPVSGTGTYTVSFSTGGIGTETYAVTISGNASAKLDYSPSYFPPRIDGPLAPPVNQPGLYSFTPVGGATGYQWKAARPVGFSHIEGAEYGLSNVTAVTSAGYNPVETNIRASGNASFHLAHSQPVSQTLTCNRTIRVSEASSLIFASRLGWATSGQVARSQISTNGGNDWADLWSRAGTGSAGQAGFGIYTNSLRPFAGQEALIRFTYDLSGNSYFNQTSPGVGWYLDDIQIAHAEELILAGMGSASGTTFSFVPDEPTNYVLRIRASLGGGFLDWGPAFEVVAVTSAIPQIRLKGLPFISGRRINWNFEVTRIPSNLLRISAASLPAGPWSGDPTAAIQILEGSSNGRASVALPLNSPQVYRIVAE